MRVGVMTKDEWLDSVDDDDVTGSGGAESLVQLAGDASLDSQQDADWQVSVGLTEGEALCLPLLGLWFGNRCAGVLNAWVRMGREGSERYCPDHQSLLERGSRKLLLSRTAIPISEPVARPNGCPGRKAGKAPRPASFIC